MPIPFNIVGPQGLQGDVGPQGPKGDLSAVIVSGLARTDISKGDAVVYDIQKEGILPYKKLDNSAFDVIPHDSGRGMISRNGAYLVTSLSYDPPYINVYKRNGDTFTKMENTGIPPTRTASDATLSPDGTYLAVCYSGTSFLTIYKRTGDTFIQLETPSGLPASPGYPRHILFSPDGTYLILCHDSTPYMTIWKRSGDTFTVLTKPTVLPEYGVSKASFSEDGVYLALLLSSNPYLAIYKRNGDTFTKLTMPDRAPASSSQGIALTPDGIYLAVSCGQRVYVYKRNGDTFTRLDTPDRPDQGTSQDIVFSPSGEYLVGGNGSTSGIPFVYKRNGDVFTKITGPISTGAAALTRFSFTSNGEYLCVRGNEWPFISVYKRISEPFSVIEEVAYISSVSKRDAGLPWPILGYGYATEDATIGQNVSMCVLIPTPQLLESIQPIV